MLGPMCCIFVLPFSVNKVYQNSYVTKYLRWLPYVVKLLEIVVIRIDIVPYDSFVV